MLRFARNDIGERLHIDTSESFMYLLIISNGLMKIFFKTQGGCNETLIILFVEKGRITNKGPGNDLLDNQNVQKTYLGMD